MSKFHSTMTRRNFMKALGFGAAGLGAAGAAAPVFHDLDELTSSAPKPLRQRRWWIKEVDEPTVEIDWNLMARHHGFHSTQSGAILARYCDDGPAGYSAILAQGSAGVPEGIKANTPGLTLRDNALGNASFFSSGAPRAGREDATGYTAAPTPESYGVPKWQGTPEENSQMLKAAMVFYGASDVGFSEVDEHHKKLIGIYGDNISQSYFPWGSSPKWPPPDSVTQPIVFKDQPDFEYNAVTSTTIIPSNKPLYSVGYTIPQSNEMMRTAPSSGLWSAANAARYRLRENARCSTQAFIRGIGYQSLHDSPYRGFLGNATAVLTGLTEQSRHTIMSISPEHGSTVGVYDMMTDLPLEHTKPIDAGINRFCDTCGVCADHCPPGAIEKKGGREKSWEVPPSSITPKWDPFPGLGFSPMGAGESEYFKLGRKTYWTDMISCQLFARGLPNRCQLCFGVCVFNSQYVSAIHDIVRGTVATTSLFNSFFTAMHGTFGYGLKEGEEKDDWWEMSLPSYGYDTTVGAKHGGYR
jgi:reductive dehalogenase